MALISLPRSGSRRVASRSRSSHWATAQTATANAPEPTVTQDGIEAGAISTPQMAASAQNTNTTTAASPVSTRPNRMSPAPGTRMFIMAAAAKRMMSGIILKTGARGLGGDEKRTTQAG